MEEEIINNNECSILHYTTLEKKKDHVTSAYLFGKNRTLRVNKEMWETFKGVCKNLGFSRSQILEKAILSLIENKPLTLEGKNILNFNINIQTVQQQQQVAQKIDMREFVTEAELNKWFNIAENMLIKDGKIYPHTREKILKLASKLRRPKPETFEKIKKITEF